MEEKQVAELMVAGGKPDESTKDDVEKASMAKTDNEEPTDCGKKCSILCKPIAFEGTVQEDNGDTYLKIVILPEALRMWFYMTFFGWLIVGVVMTNLFNPINADNNLIVERFGTTNLCMYFDDPPFSYIAATLYLIPMTFFVSYSVLDYFRVLDHYNDEEIKPFSRCFLRYYLSSTVFEAVCMAAVIQATATSPYENMYIHFFPYLFALFGLWTLAMKKFLYFYHTKVLHAYHPKLKYVGWLYVLLMFASVSIKALTGVPNLFHARLWEIESLAWTSPIVEVNGKLYLVLTFVLPVCIYLFFLDKLDAVTLTLNRTKLKQTPSA